VIFARGRLRQVGVLESIDAFWAKCRHKYTKITPHPPQTNKQGEKPATFAVGHMSLGYLLGKASAKPLGLRPNVALLMVLSILPDIDILAGIHNFHRGPTHSVIAAILIFIPFFIVYRKRAFPYFLALISHALIGDLVVGGNLQLFWPLTTESVTLPAPFPHIEITSNTNVAIEISLFVVALVVLAVSRDYKVFFRRKLSNLTLVIPVFTVLLPTFVAYPLEVPVLLIPPHLFYLALFAAALIILAFPRQETSPRRS
jgi:LexA-binding, inner membrane-associated putative hydrolase